MLEAISVWVVSEGMRSLANHPCEISVSIVMKILFSNLALTRVVSQLSKWKNVDHIHSCAILKSEKQICDFHCVLYSDKAALVPCP